ncbi:suppressor of fused domain protein [Flavobacterium ajazii]|uniref:suppressor of fused domain protein n=1 Tax=Flavobacterium ajazii TaxID=2692318 RepID=UPI0013D2463E|nr:suppressor of fused domain protein [Flavobacterium ajazii]
MSFFKNLFGGKNKGVELPTREFTEDEYNTDYELKEQGLESVLGKMHGIVGHAIIPFSVGGTVDMYYFKNHIKGTGFATMELLNPDGFGPKANRIGTYELVGFTKLDYNDNEENQTEFNSIERRFCGIFTTIGNYASQAILNPNETIEVPNGTDENNCLILDNYKPDNKEFKIGERSHHLLLCLEVFRSEMDFARKNGSDKLINLLKEKGFYPYSDLDRKPVA